jgi:DNA-binding transcriptional LysR family regulator
MRKSTRKKAKQFSEYANPELRWDDLRVLLALHRTRTLSGAGQQLGVNVSTIARRLEALEDRAGVHLFDRTPSGVAPSEAAEALLPVAESMERVAAEAQHVLAGRETLPEGVVRISAPPGISSRLLAPTLVDLRRRHPGLRFEIDASVAYVDLTRREADVALRAMRPHSGDLVSVRLIESGLAVAGSRAIARKLERLTNLDAVDWITWDGDLAHLDDGKFVRENVDPARIVLRTSSMDTQIQAAVAGLGVMLVHRPFVPFIGLEALTLSPGLAARLAAVPTASLWLVGHRALREIPRVRAVWDWLVELFAGS